MEVSDFPQFPMRVVSRRTALSPHVIRVWERRYGAVAPPRTDTNRRLYSERDIRRLALLRQATAQGHSIGLIATRTLEELDELVRSGSSVIWGRGGRVEGKPDRRERDLLLLCKDGIARMDRAALDSALGQAATELTTPELLGKIISPLMDYVGRMWREGELRVAHEHLATDAVRSFLSVRRVGYGARENSPAIVVTTPAGQIHEIGALMASVLACADGWRDVYLGPNLPADDIIAAVRANGARAVALSVVYPSDDPFVSGELAFLRRHLPEDVHLFIGGRASAGYRDTIKEVGAELCSDLEAFRVSLERIRNTPVFISLS